MSTLEALALFVVFAVICSLQCWWTARPVSQNEAKCLKTFWDIHAVLETQMKALHALEDRTSAQKQATK